ncbi:hypothetical protein [Novipirellula rosea]|uniref:Uncharacterized protein n=1 Tax=Novipirellula rosea TaxID=1031540 RepID=A0ABP8MTY0_9BACT
MAGDWLKIETTTPDKPEVFRIADELGIDPDAVVGKLFRVWVWADQQTFDGNASSVTRSLLDRISGVSNFADAMLSCGWLVESEHGLTFPNFDRHNGKTAKTRALTRKRVENHRNACSVTSALPEKRRGREDKESSARTGKTVQRFVPPTLDEVRAYCRERSNAIDAEQFVDHYTANGWCQGRGKPIRDWKAAVRTWERNGYRSESSAVTPEPTSKPGLTLDELAAMPAQPRGGRRERS